MTKTLRGTLLLPVFGGKSDAGPGLLVMTLATGACDIVREPKVETERDIDDS